MHDVAQSYRSAGLCVLPARRAEKRPAINGRWEPYKTRLPTAAEIGAWFANGCDALCLVCGPVSGGLEMIDFDCAGELFDAWKARVESAAPGLLARLVIESTPSSGWHVAYRAGGDVCGNLKLAQRKQLIAPEQIERDEQGRESVFLYGKKYAVRTDADGTKHVLLTLIETRGEGGLFLCAPTSGYQVVQGDLCALPTLTAAERHVLLTAAWELNEYMPPPPPAPECGRPRGTTTETRSGVSIGNRPGDDYNSRGDPRNVLEQHGWVRASAAGANGNEYWRRPGKDVGTSATLKDRVFYVFSSNAAPFEPNRPYSPFAVYALLEHAGDFESAARALRGQGFGGDDLPHPDAGVDLSGILGADTSNPSATPSVEADSFPSVQQLDALIDGFTGLNPPIIHGMLREGETMNIIASPKTGKSWFVSALAISIASGLDWLGLAVEPGRVLHIDNELHACTSTYRYNVISEAMRVPHRLFSGNIDLVSLRGQLRDLYAMGRLFSTIDPGRYKLVIIDAFYRTLPSETDENDNGAIANLYNTIDRYAAQLQCAFVLIHHTSKGNQAGKAVTDVGAGAGSQSRAADAHLVLRPHEDDDVIVLESAVRSWPPMEPKALLWKWPLFIPTEGVDTTALMGAAKPKTKANEVPLDDFVEQCIAINDPCSKRSVVYEAGQHLGLAERKAEQMLDLAIERGVVSRVQTGSTMRYVKSRPGAAGDKALWIAAILAHDPDADVGVIAKTVDVSERYVRQIRNENKGLTAELDPREIKT